MQLYYSNPRLNRSQWEHPLEGYYKGLVFMVCALRSLLYWRVSNLLSSPFERYTEVTAAQSADRVWFPSFIQTTPVH